MTQFGAFVREKRLQKEEDGNRRFSLRQVAKRAEIEPAYLSKIERGVFPPPGEQTTLRLAKDLGLNADELLAMGGKVSSDVIETILARPNLFPVLIRKLKDVSDDALSNVVDFALEAANPLSSSG